MSGAQSSIRDRFFQAVHQVQKIDPLVRFGDLDPLGIRFSHFCGFVQADFRDEDIHGFNLAGNGSVKRLDDDPAATIICGIYRAFAAARQEHEPDGK